MALGRPNESTQTYAEILSDFVIGWKSGATPPHVVRQAELSTLDFIGVALAGSDTPAAKAVSDLVRSMAGAEEATVFGSRTRVPLSQAAIANGTMAHSVELDDHEAHHRSKVHPGVVVMPVAWAASEIRRVSGADFLAAVVIGYDIIGRLSAATRSPDFLGVERGFHTTPLFGPFAAGATAGRLLGLTRDELTNAFGIIGSMCSGLAETMAAGSWVKGLHAGWAAHSGIVAVQLAQRGFTGPTTVLEGRKGFYRAFCGDGNFDLDVIDAGLGAEFDITLIMYKAYACAGGIHSPLTAVDAIRSEVEIRPEDVAEIVVVCSAHAADSFASPREAKYRPQSGAQAQFSLPFAVAALVTDGAALVEQFTDDAVRRPELLRLAALVRIEVSEQGTDHAEEEPSSVTIRLKDGRSFESAVSGGKGSLTDPMTDEQLKVKFHRLADPKLGETRAREIEDRILALASDEDVGDLPGHLALTN